MLRLKLQVSNLFCLKMVKEQKGRLEEISKGKQEMQLNFKVDGCPVFVMVD